MISKAQARELILDLFEEEALMLGGMFAVHEVDDDMVWQLIRCMDAVRLKTLRRLEDLDQRHDAGKPQRRPNLKPHPAIEDFLLMLRRS